MEYEQLTITDSLQKQIDSYKVMDLTVWINSQGKAQYTQIAELIEKRCKELEIDADEEQLDRLTNHVSVWVLEQAMGYMKYLRGI